MDIDLKSRKSRLSSLHGVNRDQSTLPSDMIDAIPKSPVSLYLMYTFMNPTYVRYEVDQKSALSAQFSFIMSQYCMKNDINLLSVLVTLIRHMC